MNLPTITKNILLINIAVFLLTQLFGLRLSVEHFALFPISNPNFQIWQFISHMFLHGDILHILFNMLMFVSFAPFCEKVLGEKRFTIFYLVSGVFASIFYLMFAGPSIPIIGASGAMFSIFIFFTLCNPEEKIYLFFIPIGIRIKIVAIGLLIFEIWSALFGSNDGVGHTAHIGGAIFGTLIFLSLNKWEQLRNLSTGR